MLCLSAVMANKHGYQLSNNHSLTFTVNDHSASLFHLATKITDN